METHNSVVLAADGISRARVAANANDADRGAGEADEDIDALNDDAEQAKEGRTGRRLRLHE